jgi:hypothetical protein
MALPETVRVKLSSEDAGTISLTPVVTERMRPGELVELLLGVAGKDIGRIREILLAGTVAIGATRFRWSGFEADEAALAELLAGFPDADPARPFDAARAVRVRLRGGRDTVEIQREAAARFWDALVALAGAAPRYGGYSYKDRADYYIRELDAAGREGLRAALRERIHAGAFDRVEWIVAR